MTNGFPYLGFFVEYQEAQFLSFFVFKEGVSVKGSKNMDDSNTDRKFYVANSHLDQARLEPFREVVKGANVVCLFVNTGQGFYRFEPNLGCCIRKNPPNVT